MATSAAIKKARQEATKALQALAATLVEPHKAKVGKKYKDPYTAGQVVKVEGLYDIPLTTGLLGMAEGDVYVTVSVRGKVIGGYPSILLKEEVA